MPTTTSQRIVEMLATIPPNLQRQVLIYMSELSDDIPEETPIPEFLELADTIPLEDLEQMKQAIEEGCEQFDASE